MSKTPAGSINDKQSDRLFGYAAKKQGSDPATLKREFQNGKYDRAVSSLSKSDAEKLRRALADPAMTAKVLSSPQAQAIMKKLSGDK